MTTKKKKTTTKKAAKRPSQTAEKKAAATALKLVDEAATLLRKGISTTAETSEKTRLEAKKKAHSLLTKASSSLEDILAQSTSALHRVITKL